MFHALARHARLKGLIAATVAASALFAAPVHATVITSLPDSTARPINPTNEFTAASTSTSGMTFSSTIPWSVYGYTGGYGLNGNGFWNGNVGPYIGLNASGSDQFMTIAFDQPVASFLAFFNYASNTGTPYIAAYDSLNNLIETFALDISTPGASNGGAYFGFQETSNIIQSIRFGDAYIVAANLQTGAAAVPIPGTLPLIGLGLGLLVVASRRRRKAGSVPANGAMPAMA